MTKDKENTLEMIGSFITLIGGIILIFVGLLLPPKGVIDPSVLVAFGEMLTFVGSVFGIRTKYQSKLNDK